VKKCLWFAVTMFLATIPAAPIANADSPTCGPNGCSKPGIRSVLPGTLTGDSPTCGPSGCSKPGLV
jgi:hypothetical protein